jgi:hypothetical protein
MKNNDDIPSTDTTEIKRLINRVKQGELDQGDSQLIVSFLELGLTAETKAKPNCRRDTVILALL